LPRKTATMLVIYLQILAAVALHLLAVQSFG